MSLKVKLKELLNDYITNSSTAFVITRTDNGTTMYSSADVLTVMQKWYDYYFVYPELDPPSTIYNPKLFFITLWRRFVTGNAAGLTNLYKIFDVSDYDPISNYDMTEEAADGTRLDKATSTSIPSGETEVQADIFRTGLDSSDPVLTDRTTTTTSFDNAKTEIETNPDNTKSMDFDGSTKTGYHEAKEHYLKRSGNIGVTTTQQMAESEIQLRRHDLLVEFVGRFINEYCYYVG